MAMTVGGSPFDDIGKHRRLVELAAAHFMEHGYFPELPDLLRQCAREGVPLEYDFSDPLSDRLGFVAVGQPQEVILNITGLAQTDMARDFLDDVVRLAQFEYETYLGEGGLNVTSDDVQTRFGMTDGTIIRLGRILRTEPYLNAGWSSGQSPSEWSALIDEKAIELKDVMTVDDLLALRERMIPRRWTAPEQNVQSPTPSTATARKVSNYSLLDVEHLHPIVRQEIIDLVIAGFPQKTILDAAKAYAEVLRCKTGLREDADGRPLDGTNLVEHAFARFWVGPDRRSQTRYAAARDLASGMMRLYRNQSAHELEQVNPHEACEAIATFSMLSRLADAATLIS